MERLYEYYSNCKLILLPISIIITLQFIFLHTTFAYFIGSDVIDHERSLPKLIILDSNKEDLPVVNVSSGKNYTTKIVLYGLKDNYLIEGETVSFNGYLDVQKGLPNKIIRLYEINDSDEDCLLSEYKIEDPISTHFTFTLTIDQPLINCDENFDKDHQLEFIAKSNSNYSDIVKAQIFSSKEELPVPRLEFKPESYNIPVSVNVTFSSNNLNMSSATAFLNHYHLNDEYSDSLERYFPLESLGSGDARYPIFVNQSQGNIIVILEPNSETRNSREPSFLNVFLRENNADKDTDHSENISYGLYELRQTSQDPWSFAIPLVPEGSYDLVIRSYFTDIMGEYVLHDIVIN